MPLPAAESFTKVIDTYENDHLSLGLTGIECENLHSTTRLSAQARGVVNEPSKYDHVLKEGEEEEEEDEEDQEEKRAKHVRFHLMAPDSTGPSVLLNHTPFLSMSPLSPEPSVFRSTSIAVGRKALNRNIVSRSSRPSTYQKNGNDDNTRFKNTATKLAEECGWNLGNRIFSEVKQSLLEVVNSLGSGSLGVVEEVRTSISRPSFVRKRVQLQHYNRRQRLKVIEDEAKILRSLEHTHIVTLLGTYQEIPPIGNQFYSLLMLPVGHSDLANFLQLVANKSGMDQIGIDIEVGLLRKWFKCLASALAYIHSQGVRHQDIKPSNIIRRSDHIFFSDFGSAGEFQIDQTTSTENLARTTAMYAAPEVVDNDGTIKRHGLGTDVFALGVVFSEMLTVVCGKSVDDFHQFFLDTCQREGSQTTVSESARKVLRYGQNPKRIDDWFRDHDFYNTCVRDMLARCRGDRPAASTVSERIRKFPTWELAPCACDPQFT